MAFQRLQTSVLVLAVCLVLVITSAGNFKVSAAAQQFEAQTLEGGCPVTQDDFERVKSDLLQGIGPLIETGLVTQSPTTRVTTQQSTTLATMAGTTEQSTTLATTGSTKQSITLPTTGVSAEQSTTLATTRVTTEQSTTLPTTGETTKWRTGVTTEQRLHTLPTTGETTKRRTGVTIEQSTTLPTTGVTTEQSTTLATTGVTTEQSTTLPTTGQTTEQSTTLPTTGETTEQSTTLPTTGQTTEQSTTLPTTGQTTEQSTTLPTPGETTKQSTTPPTTGETTEQSTTLPTTGETTEQSTTLPTTGETTEQSTSTTTEPLNTCNGTPGWRRVVFIDMTDTRYNCPPGLNLTSYSKRTCGRAHTNIRDCSATTFSVGGSEYSRVCGRIRGYQVGQTSAFNGYFVISRSIEQQYIDGVSLTHGAAGGRQHIWTFAAGLNEVDNGYNTQHKCPCDTSDEVVVSPPFVGNDYFCESGLHSPWNEQYNGVLIPDDPLWDGQNCTSTSTCCQFNNPPRFTKNLPSPTTDDIELRICLDNTSMYDDTPLELIELYVQ